MKVFVYILIIISFADVYSQSNFGQPKTDLADNVQPFFIEKGLQNATIKIFSSPKEYPMLQDEEFTQNHLRNPVSVIQSYLIATDTNWLNSLFHTYRLNSLSQKIIDERNTEYKNNCTFKVLSELNFQLDEKKYQILSIKFNHLTQVGDYIKVFFLIKDEGEWKIYRGELSELAGLLYIKPRLIEEIFLTEEIQHSQEVEDFMKFYVSENKYNISPSKGLLFCYHFKGNTCFPEVLISVNSYIPPKSDILIELKNFGYIQRWSKSNGRFCKMEEPDNPNNHIWFQTVEPTYNSLATLALATWTFEPQLDQKLLHVTNKANALNSIKEYEVNMSNSDLKEWHISIKHTLTFHDPEYEYQLIFYDLYTHNNIKHTGRWALMRKKNDMWFLVKEKYSEDTAIRIAGSLADLNSETLQALFLKEQAPTIEIQKFIANITDNQNRIFVNTLPRKIMENCTPATCNFIKELENRGRQEYR